MTNPTTLHPSIATTATEPHRSTGWIHGRLASGYFARQSRPSAGSVRARIWNGKPLTVNDFVISDDEKTSIEARCRCHRTLPPGRSRTMRVNHT